MEMEFGGTGCEVFNSLRKQCSGRFFEDILNV
jgi:hypothetical protein